MRFHKDALTAKNGSILSEGPEWDLIHTAPSKKRTFSLGLSEGGKMREAGNDVDIHRSPSNPLGIIYIFTGLKYQEAIHDCDCRNSYVVSPFDRI